MERTVYPRLFSTVAGLALVALGLAGFIAPAGFRNPEITSNLLGFYPVNGWANAFHLVAGLIGLGFARLLPRFFALVAGAVFFGLGIWGILAPNGELLLGGLPATRSVNVLNLVIGGLGLLAFVASRWDRIRAAGATWYERAGRRIERWRRQRQRRRALRRRRPRPAGESDGRRARPGSDRTPAAGKAGARKPSSETAPVEGRDGATQARKTATREKPGDAAPSASKAETA